MSRFFKGFGNLLDDFWSSFCGCRNAVFNRENIPQIPSSTINNDKSNFHNKNQNNHSTFSYESMNARMTNLKILKAKKNLYKVNKNR